MTLLSQPLLLGLVLLAALAATSHFASAAWGETFGADVQFLQQHTDLIVLGEAGSAAQVAVAPELQGRVMTSTAGGSSGNSYGWINRKLFASGAPQKQIHAFGGEDRFWLGPEGGQFSLFFAPGSSFTLAEWQTPAALDTEPFEVIAQSPTQVDFRRRMTLTNYSGTQFQIQVDRQVRLLDAKTTWQHLALAPSNEVKSVAYESINRITNAGDERWTKTSGLVSVWILGMFNPSPATTIVVPVKTGSEDELGPVVTSDYFGEVPAERLIVRDGTVFFSADGTFRSKIGISPLRAKPVLGSYDAANKILTLVQYTLPADARDYVNSQWKLQEQPFAGDATNAYNDGPPSPGAEPLGPFYELESSSPAAALAPDESLTHVHRTMHFEGSEAALDRIARQTLGVSLAKITAVLPK